VIRVYIGQINARVRGLNSRLLSQEKLDSLLIKPDIDAIIAELQKTDYKEDVEKASVHHSGIRCIEEALRLNLIKTYNLLQSFVEGEKYEKYIKIILNKWDIQNIKTILRGKKIHVPFEEVFECVVPAGELDEVTLVELMKQPDVKAVIDLLATWEFAYSRILMQNFSKYADTGNLAVLEYALDKFYYENALGAISGKNYDDSLVREIFSTEIDIINIKTILRLIRDKVEIDEGKSILIDGGKWFEPEELNSLLESQNVDSVVASLDRSPYEFLKHIQSRSPNGVKISIYERELDRFLTLKGMRLYRGDPLSISLVMGYIWAKNNEIKNIRIISQGKAAFIPEDELREDLIYV
jgi:V/A-type H+-transporting ATPase subunit C